MLHRWRSTRFRVCADPNNLPFSNRAGQGLENKLAQLIAHDLSVEPEICLVFRAQEFPQEFAQRRLVRCSSRVPVEVDNALITRPYYRSTYVMVTRADRALKIDSLYDPGLKDLRIGLHMVEDDYAPPGHLLAAQGLSRQIVGYSLYGAYGETNPPARLIDAVAKNEVDLAIVWGPFAGYFAKKSSVPSRYSACFAQPVPDDPVYLLDRSRGPKRGCRSSICDSTSARQGVPKNPSASERVCISVA